MLSAGNSQQHKKTPAAALRENLHALRRSGRLVFLDRSLDKLTAAADRPLSADTDALRCRYAERYDLYCAAADLRVDGDGTPEETAAQIEKEWTT